MIFFCNKVLGTQYNILQIQIIKYIDVKPINNVIFRSNSPEVFCKKGVPKNFAKFTRKHLYWSLVFDKVAGQAYNIIKKKIPAQVFSCIVILRKFQEHLFYRLSPCDCFYRDLYHPDFEIQHGISEKVEKTMLVQKKFCDKNSQLHFHVNLSTIPR